MISQERLEQALHYLATTDEEAAELRADVARAEFRARKIRETMFSHLEGTVADRQARAYASEEHSAAQEEYFAAMAKSDKVKNKRDTEAIVVETWRSLNANRRQGA